MSEQDFRDQLLKELRDIQKTQSVTSQGMTALNAKLEERCPQREIAIAKLQQDIDALWKREHQRKGGEKVLIALMGAAAAAGALLAKFLSFAGGQ